ncbi:hypothetical protein DL762_004521 [Monosporascus cannonballus]|uniref:Methyltransferase type 11 domain-containing protein n=1 Tax=Monosporascus cannonballus TaxID=155416 RepID=A0ABY0H7D9_9PEZI|nr:hypothetical protein DL762_004521 [Monosporascus cannonballus]
MRNNSQSESTRTTSSSSIPRLQIAPDAGSPHLDRGMTASPVELQSSQNVETSHATTQPTKIYPELDRYRDIQHMPASRGGHSIDVPFRLATHDLPPPTPLFSGNSSHSQLSMFSASPSTKYSESPGPGPYSRDTTPTSISSQSPGLVAPMRFPVPRVRQASPAETRPPVTRRRTGSVSNEADAYSADPHGLAAVSEALTSSSSSSTVRLEEKKGKEKRHGLLEAPPNPPARKSSQKLRKGLITKESPSKILQKPARPLMRSPSPTKLMQSSRSKSEGLVASPQSRLSPPSRPSRDGMPDLYSQFGGPMPIIHSNLSSSSLADRRLSSHLSPNSLPPAATPASSQDRSIIPSSSLSLEPTPAPRPGALQSAEPVRQEPARVTRTPSPNVSTLRSRFPIFGRRTKTVSEGTQEDKKQKPTRKGPAAGTGHEGYGRIGAVKRRSSNTAILGRGLPGPLSSSDSLASMGSMDPFLLERMNPVIIAGGEVVENRNTSSELLRTESNQSIPFVDSSMASQNNSSVSLPARDEARQTLWPSALPRTRRPSDSSDSEAVTMKPTIAFRRSTQRGRSREKPLNIPKPIMTRTIRPPSIGSVATIILTDGSVLDPRPAVAYKEEEPSAGPKKLTKLAKSPRKWNLFGRSHSQPSTDVKKKVGADLSQAAKPEQSKTVAYYTLMDSSEQEDTEEQDVGAILREAGALKVPQLGSGTRERSAPLNSQSRGVTSPHAQPARDVSPVRPGRSPVCEQLVPQPGQLKPTIRHTPSISAPERPSRLPHVGRIPKVVNTRPKQSSPKSFSRPFHRLSFQRPPNRPVPVDDDSVAKGPSPPRPLSPDSAYGESSVVASATKTNIEDQGPSRETFTRVCQPKNEFLSFSPRQDSEYTTTSTSGSSGMIGHANHVAVLPGPSAPPGEDEVWDEYNDLLGDVPPSATSSHGHPFHLETYETKLAKMPSKPLESPTIRNQRSKDVRGSTETGKTARSSSHYSAEMTARINAAFRFGSEQPNTPLSLSEFVSGYGDRNNDKSGDQEGNAPVSSRRSSSCSNRSRRTKANSFSSRSSEETPLSQVNLRVGSMTVSKWLTFGHVLFSPARDDLINAVGSLKRHSILVIDGLGNDDWSFYAAETYPAATFFNMSPRAPIPQDQKSSSSFPLSPPNHHQIQYTSHKDKFPFGPDSFTSVVFRFPTAAPEAYYRNIIAEAWRVLKPGGYIELSILDVDLNNMGNRTRRAVRRLKERVAAQNPDFNLSSTADLILRLLGRRGFTDVKTCRVGVPVASPITKSSGKEGGKKDERSLAEMMNDETEAGDENIGKMVSKVGRWWYNRCYEVPTGMDRSIWNDRALLAECEEWGTSLKLMVCHARIPESRGRVASI